jgi:hypothetical protein
MVTLNTPGQSNGNQRLWIDGALRGAWSGLRFRSSSVLRLNAVQLTFSRSTAEASTAQKLWVDNLVVSTRRPSS